MRELSFTMAAYEPAGFGFSHPRRNQMYAEEEPFVQL